MIEVTMMPDDRRSQYDSYLSDHIANVQKAWREILRSAIDDEEVVHNVDLLIKEHDRSKYEDEEYFPYLDHFYPEDGSEVDEDKDDPEFDKAWLKHIHKNPHHWQYWVLHRDSGDSLCIPMPMESICEMLCDWSSFQYTGSGTANEWYQNNKSKMMFDYNTRKIIEDLLERCSNL